MTYKLRESVRQSRQFESYLLEAFTPTMSECRLSKRIQNHLIIAVIVKRGKVIASATNGMGSRSMGAGYSDYTIHAERAVVKRLGDISKLKGSIMYVWRVTSRFNDLMSKPCHDCELFLEKCMKQCGLRAVYYTQNTGESNCHCGEKS